MYVMNDLELWSKVADGYDWCIRIKDVQYSPQHTYIYVLKAYMYYQPNKPSVLMWELALMWLYEPYPSILLM